MLALDAGHLDGTSGLPLLLRRALSRLAPGTEVALTIHSPSAAHDVPALLRADGHPLDRTLTANNSTTFHFRRGHLSPIAVAAPPNPAHAPPDSGFALRETLHEGGLPHVPFALDSRDELWLDEARSLYDQAVANQWSVARDLDWSGPATLGPDLDWAIAQIMSFLAENEVSALLVPAGFLHRIHPHFAEVSQFLASRIADEARHIDAFRARAARATSGHPRPEPVYSTRSTRASLLTLVEERDFTTAEFLLGVLGEGTFLELLRFVETHAPDPLTAEIARRARLDESRHVHFAMAHVRTRIAADPGVAPRLAAAARARSERLAATGPLNPFFDDALCVLAAGGLDPARLPAGIDARHTLEEEMRETRARRLTAIGFSSDEAAALSSVHTPNFM
jgi:hypothetical protein